MKMKFSRILAVTFALCLLLTTAIPFCSFGDTQNGTAGDVPKTYILPDFSPEIFNVTLEHEYSFLDKKIIESMFDGMGFWRITDVNGNKIVDPELQKDFQRKIILYIEEPGESNILDAIENVRKLDFVFDASVVVSNYSPSEQQYLANPADGAFSFDKVLVVLDRSYNLAEMEEIEPMFEGMGFSGIKDLAARSLKKYKAVEGYDFSKFTRILALTLKEPNLSNVLVAVNSLKKKDFIRSAEPNYCRFASDNAIGTDDPEAQWALVNINISAAWAEYGSNASNSKVGVIDTGISPHEDLDLNLIAGDNFYDNIYYDTTDYFFGHGTHVAGIIGAVGNNGIGISGVVHSTAIAPLKVIFESDHGPWFFDDAIVDAVYYAQEENFDVINMSFEGSPYAQGLYELLENFEGLAVCAAGNGDWRGYANDNDIAPVYPASYDLPNVISVAAVDLNNELVIDSNWGWNSNYGANSVHIAAPGQGIISTVSTYDDGDDAYVTWSGTSMAAPHVSGVAALMKSCFPDAAIPQIRKAILSSAVYTPSLSGMVSSNGRLDALGAMDYMNMLKKYDLNKDTVIDALDLGILLLYAGFKESDPEWTTLVKVNDTYGNPVYAYMVDSNNDGVVDMLDIVDLFVNYTK